MSFDNGPKQEDAKLLLEKLRVDFEQLKIAFKNPKLYIANYCDELRNCIDLATLETEMKLISMNNRTNEFTQSQNEMINQTKSFEDECQRKLLEKDIFDTDYISTTKERIDEIENKIENIDNSIDIPGLDYLEFLIESCIDDIHAKIFIKKGLVFLSSSQLDSEYKEKPFNKLLIVKDLFIRHNVFVQKR